MKQQPAEPSFHNLAYIEALHEIYRRDRESLAPEWQQYFESGRNGDAWPERSTAESSFRPPSIFNPPPVRGQEGDPTAQERLNRLIRAYRVPWGITIAQVHPIGAQPDGPPELDPSFFGFTHEDLQRVFSCETLFWPGPLTLGQILQRLRHTYCRSIGVQYMHIDDLAERRWLQERIEGTQNRIDLSREIQIRILTRLTDAVIFEEFVRKKFLGAKTFSLEGCESLIPLLDLAIEKAGGQGVKEIVMGMAHRGRLNVLANSIIGKRPRQMSPRVRRFRTGKTFGQRRCEISPWLQPGLDDWRRPARASLAVF